MLAHAARVVAPGGVLVYATCSSEPDENDAVADAFLDAHPAFEPAGPPPAAPAGVGGLLTEDGRLHTSPVTHGLEAFFAAAFRRRRLDRHAAAQAAPAGRGLAGRRPPASRRVER